MNKKQGFKLQEEFKRRITKRRGRELEKELTKTSKMIRKLLFS